MTLSKSKIEEIADLTSPYLPSSLKEKFLSSLEDNKTYSFIIINNVYVYKKVDIFISLEF